MKATLRVFLLALIGLGFSGCETGFNSTTTKEEREIMNVSLDGLKLGDRVSSLSRFAQTQLIPYGRSDYQTYEIYNPNPQISMAVAYFRNGRLKKLELRYYDSSTLHTLARAGGWVGLRNYLITRFGNPSRSGPEIPLETYVGGLQPKYAQFNGEWIFSRINRKLNYIAFSDSKGGLGLVTITDTTPVPTTPGVVQPTVSAVKTPPNKPSAPVVQQAPNPGF
ncbi:hypothetical protein BH09VER1_BH09VER1_29860 [soil metagenome]